MKFNKKIFAIFLILTLIAGGIPGIVIGVIIPQLAKAKTNKLALWSKYNFNFKSTNFNKTVDPSWTNKGWDPEVLKKQIQKDRSFIVYFGSEACHYCKKLTKNIQKNVELTQALNRGAKKQKKKFLLYLYYIDGNLDTPKRRAMNKSIIDIFDELKFTDWKTKVKTPEGPFSFPTWFFFKNGKLVEIIDYLTTQVFADKIIKKINEHY